MAIPVDSIDNPVTRTDRDHAYYERLARRYCELMGYVTSYREGEPSWQAYARRFKSQDAEAQARHEIEIHR